MQDQDCSWTAGGREYRCLQYNSRPARRQTYSQSGREITIRKDHWASKSVVDSANCWGKGEVSEDAERAGDTNSETARKAYIVSSKILIRLSVNIFSFYLPSGSKFPPVPFLFPRKSILSTRLLWLPSEFLRFFCCVSDWPPLVSFTRRYPPSHVPVSLNVAWFDDVFPWFFSKFLEVSEDFNFGFSIIVLTPLRFPFWPAATESFCSGSSSRAHYATPACLPTSSQSYLFYLEYCRWYQLTATSSPETWFAFAAAPSTFLIYLTHPPTCSVFPCFNSVPSDYTSSTICNHPGKNSQAKND